MSVYEKLQKVQSSLNVPKGQLNSFGGYRYRSCEDIMEAVKPLLAQVGAALIVGDELVQVGDRFYIRATARFIDIQDGTELTNTAWAREPDERKGMDVSQITGATSSYARKYSLAGLLVLDDEKDADTMDNSEPKKKQAPKEAPKQAPKLATKYVKSLQDELNRTGVSLKSLMKNYGVNDLADMTDDQYKDAMSKFEAKPDKAVKQEPIEALPINPPEVPDNLEDPELPWNQGTPLEQADKSKKKSKRQQANELYDEVMGDGKFT